MIDCSYDAISRAAVPLDRFFNKVSLSDFKVNLKAFAAANGMTEEEADFVKLPEWRNMMASVCQDKEKLKLFVDALSPQQQRILQYLVWQREKKVDKIEEYLGEKIRCERMGRYHLEKGIKGWVDIPCFIVWNLAGMISRSYDDLAFLPNDIKEGLRCVIKKPDDYELVAFQRAGEHKPLIRKNDTAIFEQLLILREACHSSVLKFTNKGIITAASFKKLRGLMDLDTFPSENYAKKVHGGTTSSLINNWQASIWSILAKFIFTYFDYRSKIHELDGEDLLKKLLDDFSTVGTSWIEILDIHLRGTSINERGAMTTEPYLRFLDLLKQFEPGAWYDMKSCAQYLIYRDFGEIYPKEVKKALFYTVDVYGYKEREYINFQESLDDLEIPMIYGFVFLFEELGILEFEFSETTSKKPLQFQELLLTIIQSVRLTPLGAYFLGKSEKKELGQSYSQQVSEKDVVRFSHSQLLLRYTGKNKILQNTLKQFSNAMSDGYYQVSEKSVISCCESELHLKDLISKIESLSDGELPKIWNQFLDQLYDRVYEYHASREEYRIVSLEENPELIRKLSSVRWLTKSAELLKGNRILIPVSMESKLMREIQKLGYLVSYD